jgi:phosphotransferase system HPr (HPr) family protein
MQGDTVRHKLLITNPQGFHLRPATAFAQLAQRYQATVVVCKDDRRVNGKSPWEILQVLAPQGAELMLELSGPDAREALRALVEMLETLAFEEDPEPPLPPKG